MGTESPVPHGPWATRDTLGSDRPRAEAEYTEYNVGSCKREPISDPIRTPDTSTHGEFPFFISSRRPRLFGRGQLAGYPWVYLALRKVLGNESGETPKAASFGNA